MPVCGFLLIAESLDRKHISTAAAAAAAATTTASSGQ
jgi:hypothetical protein